MNKFPLRLATLLTALCAAGAASAGVEVSYVEPQNYADMPFASWEKDTVMKDLDQYLVKLGAKWLPANQTLKIEVLDIDLAGNIQTSRGGHQLRILKGGADWPRMEVRYTLESGGATMLSGTDKISDMNYFNSHLRDRSHFKDSLFYEKQMLNDWFRAKFAAK